MRVDASFKSYQGIVVEEQPRDTADVALFVELPFAGNIAGTTQEDFKVYQVKKALLVRRITEGNFVTHHGFTLRQWLQREAVLLFQDTKEKELRHYQAIIAILHKLSNNEPIVEDDITPFSTAEGKKKANALFQISKETTFFDQSVAEICGETCVEKRESTFSYLLALKEIHEGFMKCCLSGIDVMFTKAKAFNVQIKDRYLEKESRKTCRALKNHFPSVAAEEKILKKLRVNIAGFKNFYLTFEKRLASNFQLLDPSRPQSERMLYQQHLMGELLPRHCILLEQLRRIIGEIQVQQKDTSESYEKISELKNKPVGDKSDSHQHRGQRLGQASTAKRVMQKLNDPTLGANDGAFVEAMQDLLNLDGVESAKFMTGVEQSIMKTGGRHQRRRAYVDKNDGCFSEIASTQMKLSTLFSEWSTQYGSCADLSKHLMDMMLDEVISCSSPFEGGSDEEMWQSRLDVIEELLAEELTEQTTKRPRKKRATVENTKTMTRTDDGESSDSSDVESTEQTSPVNLLISQVKAAPTTEMPRLLTQLSVMMEKKHRILAPCNTSALNRRYQAAYRDVLDHSFMASCGMEVLMDAYQKGNHRALSAIVPMLIQDFHTQLEQLLTCDYLAVRNEMPLEHRLSTLNSKLERKNDALTYQLDNGLIWSRYPLSSVAHYEQRGKKIPQGLEWILFALELSQKDDVDQADADKVKKCVQYLMKTHLQVLDTVNQRIPENNVVLSEMKVDIGEFVSVPSDSQELAKVDFGVTKESPELSLKEAKAHQLRISAAMSLRKQQTANHLVPWHMRNILNFEKVFENLYRNRCITEGLGLVQTHDFATFNELLSLRHPNDEGSVKTLDAGILQFNLQKGAHYPHLAAAGKPVSLVTKFLQQTAVAKERVLCGEGYNLPKSRLKGKKGTSGSSVVDLDQLHAQGMKHVNALLSPIEI